MRNNIILAAMICSSILLVSCNHLKTKTIEKNKVILVNARGLSYQAITQLAKNLDQSSFITSQLKNQRLRPLEPIENAVTITNLASMETGELPNAHGVIGHSFGLHEHQYEKGTTGFSKMFAVPTFWERAVDKGKQVLNIGALITHGQSKVINNLDMVAQGKQAAPGKIIDLKEKLDLNNIELFQGMKISINQSHSELILKSHEKQIASFSAKLSPNKWKEISFGQLQGQKISAWAKWLHDEHQSKIYLRSVFANRGNSARLVQQVDDISGAAIGWPNIAAYANNMITKELLEEEISLEVNRTMELFEYLKNNKNYDLIMLDYPMWDRLGHAYSFSNIEDATFERAIKHFNQDLEVIQKFAKSNDYQLIVVSGHGFSKAHTSINLNRYIDETGVNTTKSWQVKGYPGKTSAHIYVNPEKRSIEKTRIIDRLIKQFSELRLEHSSEHIVEKILKKEELLTIGYDHKNSGDIFVLLKPGYVFQAQQSSNKPVFDQVIFKGDHGYDSRYPESKGFIINNNASVKKVIDISDEITSILEVN